MWGKRCWKCALMEQTSAELSECSGCQCVWREREEPDVLQPEDLSWVLTEALDIWGCYMMCGCCGIGTNMGPFGVCVWWKCWPVGTVGVDWWGAPNECGRVRIILVPGLTALVTTTPDVAELTAVEGLGITNVWVCGDCEGVCLATLGVWPVSALSNPVSVGRLRVVLLGPEESVEWSEEWLQ